MPSIKEKLKNCKYPASYMQNWRFFAVFCLILGIVALFGVIRLSKLFRMQSDVTLLENSFETNVSGKEGSYVASKNSNVYYFPWCGIVLRIKDSNKVWFTSRAKAEKAGYKPSASCHGLK